jgi:general secretion pathway protein I
MRSQRGFTLIEVVVAFVLLALVLSVSLEIFSKGMARSGDLDDRARALVVAQSQLAYAGAEEGLKEGVTSGATEDRRFQWTVSVRRADELATGTDGRPPSSAYALYRVDVHVAWRGPDEREHALDLSTLSTAAKPA